MNSVLFISFLLLSSQYIQAQSEQGSHEITISCGLESGRDLLDHFSILGGVHSSPISVDNSSTTNYFMSYRYFVNDLNAIGISVGMQTISGDVEDNNNASNYGWYQLSHSTIAIEWLPVYGSPGRFRLYGI